MAEQLIVYVLTDPFACAVTSVGAALGVAAGVGWTYDHWLEIDLSWEDGTRQLTAWREAARALAARTVAAVRGLLTVWRADVLWLLYTPPLRGHGQHRGAGVAR